MNELLKDQEGKITEISYLPNDKLPISVGDRKAISISIAQIETGEQFMLNAKSRTKILKTELFTTQHSLFRTSRNKINWEFRIKADYTIGNFKTYR